MRWTYDELDLFSLDELLQLWEDGAFDEPADVKNHILRRLCKFADKPTDGERGTDHPEGSS